MTESTMLDLVGDVYRTVITLPQHPDPNATREELNVEFDMLSDAQEALTRRLIAWRNATQGHTND